MTSQADDEKPGFSAPGFNWSDYIPYRPVYPTSHYERIYEHHRLHSGSWKTAHDVGAGAGIASQELAKKFERVIVSDPNDGYVNIASSRLINEFGYPKSKFTFLQEPAEESSVGDAELDLLIIFEAMHWTDIPRAMKSFARQLKKEGTVAISYYARPQILHNLAAQAAWDKIFDIWVEKLNTIGGVVERAMREANSGFDNVPFPLEDWEAGARRIVINTGGKMKPLSMSVKNAKEAPNRVSETDVREFVERDEDWVDKKNVKWLKGLFASFLPSIPEEEISDLWKELEDAAGGIEEEVEIAWLVVLLLATKR